MTRERAMGDSDNVTPLHHQVYLILRQSILEGQYTEAEAMPSEPDLSQLFGVSRITVRRALDRLQQEGLVSRARGRGTFARPRAARAPLQTDLQGIFENLVAMGLQTRVRLVDCATVSAEAQVAAALGLEPGAAVQRAVRLRYHEDGPFSHLTTYVPQEIASSYSVADLAEKPLLLLLERAGMKIAAARQTISARLADPVIARFLEVETGSALLSVRRVVLDDTGRALEFLHALYRPDVYDYAFNMSRVEQGAERLWQPVPVAGGEAAPGPRGPASG